MRKIPDNIDVFHARLNQVIEDSNINVAELEKMGVVSKTAIYNYRYTTRLPNSLVLARLSVYFNVSADWLLGLTNIKFRHLPCWIYDDGKYVCSDCGCMGKNTYSYCPNCGKMMDI